MIITVQYQITKYSPKCPRKIVAKEKHKWSQTHNKLAAVSAKPPLLWRQRKTFCSVFGVNSIYIWRHALHLQLRFHCLLIVLTNTTSYRSESIGEENMQNPVNRVLVITEEVYYETQLKRIFESTPSSEYTIFTSKVRKAIGNCRFSSMIILIWSEEKQFRLVDRYATKTKIRTHFQCEILYLPWPVLYSKVRIDVTTKV